MALARERSNEMSTPEDRRPPSLARREAIVLVGGALAGLVSSLRAARHEATTMTVEPQAGAAAPPRGAIVRTILKDVLPESLAGPILFHEHLSGTTQFSDDVGLMVEEVRSAGRDGISCIVDGGHPDFMFTKGGYRLDSLKRIAAESGVAIVASAGYYTQRSYPAAIAAMSADDIAERLVADASEQRLGAIGEIGQAGGEMTVDERKVFRAVGLAASRTGLPVFTHNAYLGRRENAHDIPRDAALRQLDLLEAAGAQPERIAIGHLCCLDDPSTDIARQIARRGAFVGFDRVTLETIHLPDADRVRMFMALVEAGHTDRLLLSSDFFSEASLKKNGGAGIGQAATAFGPKLVKAGLPAATLRTILMDNPKRFLAFVPKPLA
jgi:phosphotriesterase-related protein